MNILRRRFSAENGNYFPLGRGRSDVGKRICATSRRAAGKFPDFSERKTSIFRRRSTAISNAGNCREMRPILSLFSINSMRFPDGPECDVRINSSFFSIVELYYRCEFCRNEKI